MIERTNNALLLKPSDFTPTDDRFEVLGAFNPAAVRYRDEVILLVRVAEGVKHQEDGFLYCPHASFPFNGSYAIDRLRIVDGTDQRVPVVEGGVRRLSSVSHLELVRLASDGYTVKSIEKIPALYPLETWEEFGIEDPRITRIGDNYYVTYTAVSREMSVSTGMISTRDFENFHRHGLIFHLETKDVVLFPELIDGKYYAYARPSGVTNLRKPSIVLAKSPDLIHWGEYQYVFGGREVGFDSVKVGAGVPPILTGKGWLNIYHGVEFVHDDDIIGHYSAGAFLTSLADPAKVIARTHQSILAPEEPYETNGFVPNVIFPTGAVEDSKNPDLYHIYYGAADTTVAVATLSLSSILDSLEHVD